MTGPLGTTFILSRRFQYYLKEMFRFIPLCPYPIMFLEEKSNQIKLNVNLGRDKTENNAIRDRLFQKNGQYRIYCSAEMSLYTEEIHISYTSAIN